MTAKEVEHLLLAHGFRFVSQRGSHRKWVNDEKRLKTVVPDHGGRSLPIGTLVAIFRGTQIPDGEWHD